MTKFLTVLSTVVAVIVKLLIIIIAGLVIAKIVAGIINRSKKLDATAKNFFANFASMAIKVLTVVTALMALGIPAATFVTVLGSVGLAVGLALQGALSNFAGGILLVVFRPFKVGDHVTVSGQSGVVQSISIFYTTLLADDNTVVTLPNGTLTNAPIVNTSVEDSRRVCLEYSLPFDVDAEAVKRILIEAANKSSLVNAGITPAVNVSTHVADKITFKLSVWARSADYAKASVELEEQIKAAFSANGISCE